MNIYSLFDKKVSSYGQPFFALSDAAACRMVSMSSLDRNSLLRVFPEDYQLERIGSFVDSTGILDPCKPKVVSAVASLLIEGAETGGDESVSESSPPFDLEEDSKASS